MSNNAIRENLEQAFRRIRGMDASLNDQLKSFSDEARHRRPDFAAAVDRLVERLRENGAGESAPKPGDRLPPFYLPDDTGKIVSFDQLIAKGPVVVTFHRGHWCPYCRISFNALSRAHREIAAEGGQVVAIMPDRQEFAAELKSVGALPFPILDRHGQRLRAFAQSGDLDRCRDAADDDGASGSAELPGQRFPGCYRYPRHSWSAPTASSRPALSIPTTASAWR